VLDIFSEIAFVGGKLDIFGTCFGISFDLAHEHISEIDGVIVQFFKVGNILGSQWGLRAFLKKSIFFGPLLFNLLLPGLERIWVNLLG
jgi:hypothetical protein